MIHELFVSTQPIHFFFLAGGVSSLTSSLYKKILGNQKEEENIL